MRGVRARLQGLMRRIGMAPVEEDACLGVLNACVQLGAVRYYAVSGGGHPASVCAFEVRRRFLTL